ncbi:hypothetical protein B0T10DRAFT_561122 [Thelonectria olida]|uniref:Uncharacterized protein n=1 Tax=Thelonectria olida TaxID=1576542 RepID=A0A9P9ATA6_9HYPO|nr:hypothetical protein B0T10DRAFT_561122 [Thelonectria olida]
MNVPSHFHMPGAFHGEGVHPGLFRPPISPSSSASYGYAAPRTTAASDSHTRRKRHRDEISRSQEMPTVDDDGFFETPGPHCRPGLRHYHLAGQLDTPNGGLGERNPMDESMYSDSDYRRALGSKRTCDELDRNMGGPTPLFNLPPQPTPNQGWGSFAFSALGGVVGRMWEFCKAGAFRGFQAGGGRAFRVEGGRIQEIHSLSEKMDEDHHVPGRYPQMDHQNQYQHQQQHPNQNQYWQPETYQTEPEERIPSGASTPTGPATKRRHTDHRDDLGRNWVMVGDGKSNFDVKTPQRRPQRPAPRSRNTGPSMATGRRISTPASRPTSRLASTPTPNHRRQASRPSSRLSHAPSPPVLSPRQPSTASTASFATASFASPHSPSPSKIPQPSNSRRRHTMAPSPSPSVLGHRRSTSNASTASGRAPVEDSPRLDAEAKHLAARRKMEERDTDVRISTFNKQLQDMIRQGREALGTTIEVEGDWEENDY